MNSTLRQLTGIAAMSLVLLAGCGGGGGDQANASRAGAAGGPNANGLTEFEQEHGIGPVTEAVTIGEISPEMVKKGRELFKTKCSACHKVGERYIGPELGTVLDRRSPAYVMNMILNPDGMVKKHPEAKKLLQEYLSPMPNQNLSKEEARAIVEYLSSTQTES